MSFVSDGDGIPWSNTLYFVAYENRNHREFPLRGEQEVSSHFNNLLGNNEEAIKEARIWRHRASFYNFFANYEKFTVIKSTNYYWSFEKTVNGIYVQRSREIEDVKDELNGIPRGYVRVDGQSSSDIRFGENINDIINYFVNMRDLNNDYFVTGHNCHYFASELYEAVVRACNRSLKDTR